MAKGNIYEEEIEVQGIKCRVSYSFDRPSRMVFGRVTEPYRSVEVAADDKDGLIRKLRMQISAELMPPECPVTRFKKCPKCGSRDVTPIGGFVGVGAGSESGDLPSTTARRYRCNHDGIVFQLGFPRQK